MEGGERQSGQRLGTDRGDQGERRRVSSEQGSFKLTKCADWKIMRVRSLLRTFHLENITPELRSARHPQSNPIRTGVTPPHFVVSSQDSQQCLGDSDGLTHKGINCSFRW